MAAGPQNPNQAIDVMGPITVTHVILMIAYSLFAAIAAIWYGTQSSAAAAMPQPSKSTPNFETAKRTWRDDMSRPPYRSIPHRSCRTTFPNRKPSRSAEPVAAPIASDLNQIKGLGPEARHYIGRTRHYASRTDRRPHPR